MMMNVVPYCISHAIGTNLRDVLLLLIIVIINEIIDAQAIIILILFRTLLVKKTSVSKF